MHTVFQPTLVRGRCNLVHFLFAEIVTIHGENKRLNFPPSMYYVLSILTARLGNLLEICGMAVGIPPSFR